MDADDEPLIAARRVDEEEENEQDHEDAAGPERNDDGSFNGGVAVPPNSDGVTKSPSECDLVSWCGTNST